MQLERGGLEVAHNMRFSDIVIDDPNISLAAKGVFAAVGFLGNDCTVEELVTHTSDAAKRVRSALQELVGAGYVEVDGDRITVRKPGKLARGE